ncbi:DNA-binding transcriptional LysR family regulator [Rubricella aquisinus]|uniref:DNA-binding transcriptional LysR family regulator n=1 Tax=Rubricella aquisinus TaxID=2028108 RepID=A0A840WXH1_9RHOB|nr:LysR family transcriptional regulator [Rubricella aquisinus]MBB5515870.1 DNA-binding transcriptional LysR family regulator [Rubricella aquisinus]
MIDKLEMFILLAREQHFGRAAEAAGVTQPTLSTAIRQLEDQLGVMLVERGSRFRGLTPEGRRVLDWARQIVGDVRTMRAEMREAKRGLSGTLRIAAIPTALPMLPRLIEPFRARHGDVQVRVHSASSVDVLRWLDGFEIDVGITYLDDEPLGRVSTIPLYDERYQFITTADAPLADRDSVTWAEIASEPLCLLTPEMQNRRLINRHFEEAGAKPHPMLEANSMIVLYAHVLTGNWASILPLDLAGAIGFSSDVRAIPIVEPDATHAIGLVVPEREPHTPLVEAMLATARKVAPGLTSL